MEVGDDWVVEVFGERREATGVNLPGKIGEFKNINE